ncbi:hypothetical protein J7E95_36515 [Streptomyces sp. ISL-14]|nr:hypothetical protein [Streptomyces sp. ISL-14]
MWDPMDILMFVSQIAASWAAQADLALTAAAERALFMAAAEPPSSTPYSACSLRPPRATPRLEPADQRPELGSGAAPEVVSDSV